MKKLTVKKQVELFAQDCKLINLQYEYSGFTGTEKWAIITELSEDCGISTLMSSAGIRLLYFCQWHREK